MLKRLKTIPGRTLRTKPLITNGSGLTIRESPITVLTRKLPSFRPALTDKRRPIIKVINLSAPVVKSTMLLDTAVSCALTATAKATLPRIANYLHRLQSQLLSLLSLILPHLELAITVENPAIWLIGARSPSSPEVPLPVEFML